MQRKIELNFRWPYSQGLPCSYFLRWSRNVIFDVSSWVTRNRQDQKLVRVIMFFQLNQTPLLINPLYLTFMAQHQWWTWSCQSLAQKTFGRRRADRWGNYRLGVKPSASFVFGWTETATVIRNFVIHQRGARKRWPKILAGCNNIAPNRTAIFQAMLQGPWFVPHLGERGFCCHPPIPRQIWGVRILICILQLPRLSQREAEWFSSYA